MYSFLNGQHQRCENILSIINIEPFLVLILSRIQQVPGATDLGLMPRKVTKVAILGGGLMGSGIATAMILSNYPVILKEVNEKFLNAGIDRIKGKNTSSHIILYICG